jgi:AraC-like DNA-binding protein/mannose-6-phosphate isomerase-like protein (cupin superfamily)
MNAELLRRLAEITDEEKKILESQGGVDKKLYTETSDFTIDCRKLLRKNELIDIRPHTRFVHFPKHRHNYVEIMYMGSGKTTHIINSTTRVDVKAGDLLFLNQHTYHEILPASVEDIGVNFIILPQFFNVAYQMIEQDSVIGQFLVSTLCQEENEGQYLYFNVANVTPVQNLVENLIWTILYSGDGTPEICEYTMGLLFMHLLKHADRIDNGSLDRYENKLVFTILKYIEDHYQNANFSELADSLHQSIFKLSRLLKNSTGHTFKELLQQKRLQKATQLLMKTRLPVYDIINAVGYDNSSYFYRIFLKMYGTSPREYRKKQKI